MNWIKASKEVFAEYGVEITTERQLKDGEHIRHFELTHPMTVTSHMDSRVTLYTNEALEAYLEFVEGLEE